MITEPMTMATDYLLAVVAWVCAFRLISQGGREASRPMKLWGWAFVFTGAAAFAGGTFHGFTMVLSPALLAVLWKLTCYSLGIGSVALLAGIADAVLPRLWFAVIASAALVKFALYAVRLHGSDDFRIVVIDYGISMVAVLVIAAIGWIQRRSESSRWIVAGVLISFVAAGIQASGLTIHRHFNHNDLYHLVQIGGLWLLYRGGTRFGATPPLRAGSTSTLPVSRDQADR